MTTIKQHPKKRIRILYSTLASLTAAICVFAMLSQAQQPVLTISNLGSNQFNVVITNAVTTTNYTLFWTPVLEDQNYPWQVLGIGNVGQTNFTVDGGTWPFGWFKMLIGTDQDGDGVPEWLDAQPLNPAVGILSVTIDSPTNGMVLQ